MLTIIDTLKDRRLLGQFVKDLKTWRAWLCFLRAFFALKYEAKDRALFEQCTGRAEWPSEQAKEAWVICGTRGGKSFIVAVIGTYLAVFKKYDLSPGEKGYVLIVAPTKKQASIIKRYLSAFFNENAFLKPYLVRETSEEIELSNNIIISVLASDYKSLRGYTGIGGIIDECCFLDIEGAKPDLEVVRALRSRLLTTKGPLISISSPYWQRGTMFDVYKRHYGADGSPILVWKADSLTMNPTLDSEAINEVFNEDPVGAASDFGAEWRSDISAFCPEQWIEGATVKGRFELPPAGFHYYGFCDPSGGAHDSMVLSIGHVEDDRLVQDVLKEKRAPFDPQICVAEFATVLKEFAVHQIKGDRYSGEWCAKAFEAEGISYLPAEKTKSELYLDWIPLLARGACEVLDNPRLYNQIRRLERRASRSGKDAVDHPVRAGAKDDLSNCTAGLFNMLSQNIMAGDGIAEAQPRVPVGIGEILAGTEDPSTFWDSLEHEGNLEDRYADWD